MRLYLHPDLCKAYEPTKVGPTRVARGASVGQEGKPKQTTRRKTGGMQHQTMLDEIKYAGTAEGKPSYKCHDCGAMVNPGKEVHHDTKLSPDDIGRHAERGNEVRLNQQGGHSVRHRPRMLVNVDGQRKEHVLSFGAVTADMVPGKKMVRGHQTDTPGRCPGCHEKHNRVTVEARGVGTTPEAAAANMKTVKSMLDSLVGPIRQISGR